MNLSDCLINDIDEIGIYLTETAVFIFEMCDGKTSIQQMITATVNTYEVLQDECTDDILECIEDLVTQNIIQRC